MYRYVTIDYHIFVLPYRHGTIPLRNHMVCYLLCNHIPLTYIIVMEPYSYVNVKYCYGTIQLYYRMEPYHYITVQL